MHSIDTQGLEAHSLPTKKQQSYSELLLSAVRD
jgi:hypothetical protein